MYRKIMNICLVLLVGLTVLSSSFTTNVDAKTNKLEEIKQKGKLIVGTSADYPPYEFHATIDGKDQIVGFDIELAKEIAKDLGVELEVKDMSFNGLLAAVQANSVDMILSGMNPTDERRQSVDFSDIYYVAETSFITRKELAPQMKSIDDLKDYKLGAQQGTIQEAAAETIKPGEVRALGNILDLTQEVKNGNLDVLVVDKSIGESLTKSDSSLELGSFNIPADVEGSAVATAKNQPELITEINSTLARLKSENKIDKLYVEANELADKSQNIVEEDESKSAIVAFFDNSVKIIQDNWRDILKATMMTVLIAFFGVLFGTLIGLFLAMIRVANIKILNGLTVSYIELVRGTPLLIQIYIIFYGLPSIGLQLPPFVAGVIAISLNSAAYVAEIIRAGINAVDPGQTEAAKSLGFSYSKIMKLIVVPQAVKNILPALGNEFIVVIKESSIISVIGVGELMYVSNTIRGNTYQAFIPLFIAAIIYFILTFSLSRGLVKLERKLANNDQN